MKRNKIILITADKNVKWIYESPDGKIIYKRKMGTKKRILVDGKN